MTQIVASVSRDTVSIIWHVPKFHDEWHLSNLATPSGYDQGSQFLVRKRSAAFRSWLTDMQERVGRDQTFSHWPVECPLDVPLRVESRRLRSPGRLFVDPTSKVVGDVVAHRASAVCFGKPLQENKRFSKRTGDAAAMIKDQKSVEHRRDGRGAFIDRRVGQSLNHQFVKTALCLLAILFAAGQHDVPDVDLRLPSVASGTVPGFVLTGHENRPPNQETQVSLILARTSGSEGLLHRSRGRQQPAPRTFFEFSQIVLTRRR